MLFYMKNFEKYMVLPLQAEIGSEYEIAFGGIRYGIGICVGPSDMEVPVGPL